MKGFSNLATNTEAIPDISKCNMLHVFVCINSLFYRHIKPALIGFFVF